MLQNVAEDPERYEFGLPATRQQQQVYVVAEYSFMNTCMKPREIPFLSVLARTSSPWSSQLGAASVSALIYFQSEGLQDGCRCCCKLPLHALLAANPVAASSRRKNRGFVKKCDSTDR